MLSTSSSKFQFRRLMCHHLLKDPQKSEWNSSFSAYLGHLNFHWHYLTLSSHYCLEDFGETNVLVSNFYFALPKVNCYFTKTWCIITFSSYTWHSCKVFWFLWISSSILSSVEGNKLSPALFHFHSLYKINH